MSALEIDSYLSNVVVGGYLSNVVVGGFAKNCRARHYELAGTGAKHHNISGWRGDYNRDRKQEFPGYETYLQQSWEMLT